MKRMRFCVGLIISLVALAATAAGAAAGSPPAHATRAAKVELKHTGLGTVLANARGFTLYVFTRDTRNHNRCRAISGCSSIWPTFKTSGRPSAGPGVKRSLLGSIRLSGSTTQVTYAGRPLYGYSGDSSPGETDYVGANEFGGRWYAINANGRLVK